MVCGEKIGVVCNVVKGVVRSGAVCGEGGGVVSGICSTVQCSVFLLVVNQLLHHSAVQFSTKQNTTLRSMMLCEVTNVVCVLQRRTYTTR